MLPPLLSSRLSRDSTHGVKVSCILLSKGQYTEQTREVFMLIAVQKFEKFPACFGQQFRYHVLKTHYPILS